VEVKDWRQLKKLLSKMTEIFVKLLFVDRHEVIAEMEVLTENTFELETNFENYFEELNLCSRL
jgi:hypothetical protein